MAGPAIEVLSLGGTIAMTDEGGAGAVPTLTGEMLVAAVPELREVAQVRARSFRQIPGPHLTFDDLEELAAAIREAVRNGAAGVVVTQGTDTIEETAFVLDRLVGEDAPVVVTGAMRHPTLPGADGPANLLGAVRLAADEAARGLGTLVVLNDGIHAARFVRKAHTSTPSAFVSDGCGPVGWLVEDRVRIMARPTAVPVLAPESLRSASVALLTLGLDDDGRLIDGLAEAGFDGLVVEAMGGGHVAPGPADALQRAAGRMPVILASRTGSGEVLARTYGFTGSETDLQRRGLVRAGWLDGLKARALVTLLLRRNLDGAAVEAAFRAWGGGAVGAKEGR